MKSSRKLEVASRNDASKAKERWDTEKWDGEINEQENRRNGMGTRVAGAHKSQWPFHDEDNKRDTQILHSHLINNSKL